jgi:hypothetical protein
VDLLVQPSYLGAVHLGVAGVVGVAERPGRVAAWQVPLMQLGYKSLFDEKGLPLGARDLGSAFDLAG